MELSISNHLTVSELKEQFAFYFPFLKLEFFMYPHETFARSGFEEKADDGLLLSELAQELKQGKFWFEGFTTVAEFEQRLQEEHNLPVQVFRRSRDLWLETCQTDNLTLKQQNAMGEASTRRQSFNLHTLFL